MLILMYADDTDLTRAHHDSSQISSFQDKLVERLDHVGGYLAGVDAGEVGHRLEVRAPASGPVREPPVGQPLLHHAQD